MSQKITITLPNEIYQPLAEAASQEGRTVEELAVTRLARTVTLRSAPPASSVDRKRVVDFIGAWDSGDSNSADNERIDVDLAREYAATHDEE